MKHNDIRQDFVRKLKSDREIFMCSLVWALWLTLAGLPDLGTVPQPPIRMLGVLSSSEVDAWTALKVHLKVENHSGRSLILEEFPIPRLVRMRILRNHQIVYEGPVEIPVRNEDRYYPPKTLIMDGFQEWEVIASGRWNEDGTSPRRLVAPLFGEAGDFYLDFSYPVRFLDQGQIVNEVLITPWLGLKVHPTSSGSRQTLERLRGFPLSPVLLNPLRGVFGLSSNEAMALRQFLGMEIENLKETPWTPYFLGSWVALNDSKRSDGWSPVGNGWSLDSLTRKLESYEDYPYQADCLALIQSFRPKTTK